MPIYTPEQGREFLWENYQENFTKEEQPLRIVLLGEESWDGVTWWLYQVRFPDHIRVVTVGPRGGITTKVVLSLDQVAELR